MQVTVAKTAGFCFGVRRALELTQKSAALSPTCTLGELIHNRQVVEELAAKEGAQVIPVCAKLEAEIAELERMNAAVLGNPDGHPFYGAPVVCVVLTDPEVSTCVEDGALVIGNLMLAAHSLGVASCWIHRARQEFESAEGKALMKKWGVSENYAGIGHCILGYAAQEPAPAKPRKADFIVRVDRNR